MQTTGCYKHDANKQRTYLCWWQVLLADLLSQMTELRKLEAVAWVLTKRLLLGRPPRLQYSTPSVMSAVRPPCDSRWLLHQQLLQDASDHAWEHRYSRC